MSGGEVLMVIGTYPLVTTTFIDREILWLRREGLPVGVLAVRRPPPELPLSKDQEALAREVRYLLPARWRTALASHVSYVCRRPLTYLGLLLRLLRARHPHLRARMKTVAHFGEGVLAAYLVRSRRPRELYAHFADRAATIALVMSRLLDVPYSISLHAGADLFVEPVLLAEKVGGARCVVTCTSRNRDRLASLIGHDAVEGVRVLPHGLDLSAYGAARRSGDERPLILSVAQLRARKGHADLVRACARLRDRGYGFTCRVVGAGPQHDELVSLASELGLEGIVDVTGALAHDEVVEQYRAASMFVLACVEAVDGDVDGFPNAVAEAMASGLPVVSTNLPAIREFVADGESGILVPPADPRALADALAQLLDDDVVRRQLGERARDTVATTFDVDTNVRALRDALWPETRAQLRRQEARC